MRALVVDDDPVYQVMLKDMMSHLDLDVTVASEANQAWEILQREDSPKLVVLDWVMPGMSGPELCRHLRQDQRTRTHYIIMLTSKHQTEDLVEAMELGADDYITKPFNQKELRVRLRAGERIVNLQEEVRVLANRDLELAAQIQANLLPEASPIVPGFDIAGWSQPARFAGGDTYDFMTLPDGRLLIMLADVSGHGVGPALVVAEVRALIRAVAGHCANATEILTAANELLTLDLSEDRFATCFVGLLDPSTARLSYASAGQGPLLFFHQQAKRFAQYPATTIPLGIGIYLTERISYGESELVFRSGDFLSVVSDGIAEAVNSQGDQFGLEKLKGCLQATCHTSSRGMIATLQQAIKDFVQSTEQRDDMTAVVVRHA